MKRRQALAVLGGGALAAAGGLAGREWWRRRHASPASPAPIDPPPIGVIQPLSANLFVVPQGGGNSAVYVTAAGVLVVDTKYAARGEALLEQIRRVTDKPVTHIINTHCHGDHTGGNIAMPASAEVIVHERTAAHMDRMRRDQGAPAPRQRIRTFSEPLTLFDGPEAVDLHYFGAAHTDGDALVVFRSEGVMHAGDVFSGKIAPIINLPWGGDPAAYPETMARAVADIHGVSRVITGHGAVLDWSAFVNHAEFMRLLVAHVRDAMRDGKDWNRARQELRLPPVFDDYALDQLIFTFHDIYKGLTPWWHFW